MNTEAINTRYTTLSESSCCLSCGGAVDHAKANLGEVCVDLGCGRGLDVIRMADIVGKNGFVYGVDISEGMINKAKQNLIKFEIRNAEIIRSELEAIALPDQSVDLLISNCTINHAADKQKVWDEIHRILKKGGRFVVSDIYATKEIAPEYRNDPEAVAECWAGAVTKGEYLLMLFNAGFKDISILEESAPYEKGNAEVCSFTISAYRKSCCS